MDITDQQADVIRRWAEQEPRVRAVILVGSRAKGTSRPDSDLDLAIRFIVPDHHAEGVFHLNGEDWQNYLSRETGLKVSLLHLAGHRTPIHETAVAEHGIILYER